MTGKEATELASETCLMDLMGCIGCQTRSTTGERNKHTLNVLTSHKIGDMSGFARYCRNQLLANDVQSMGGDGVEVNLVLGRPV